MDRTKEVPVALTIAGFDGSAGAGLLADCRTFQRMGVYGTAAVTAVVAQSPGSVSGLEPVSPELFKKQLEELAGAFPIGAVKTGMLANEALVNHVADFLEDHPELPLVIDPVLLASAGHRLTSQNAMDVICKRLFPRAALVTPNINEAEAIFDIEIKHLDDLEAASIRFFEQFGTACLLKGGHLESTSDIIVDSLCLEGRSERLSSTKLSVPELHGTGCTLSAAITAELAKQVPLREAVIKGRKVLNEWMQNHHTWDSGRMVHALQGL